MFTIQIHLVFSHVLMWQTDLANMNANWANILTITLKLARTVVLTVAIVQTLPLVLLVQVLIIFSSTKLVDFVLELKTGTVCFKPVQVNVHLDNSLTIPSKHVLIVQEVVVSVLHQQLVLHVKMLII